MERCMISFVYIMHIWLSQLIYSFVVLFIFMKLSAVTSLTHNDLEIKFPFFIKNAFDLFKIYQVVLMWDMLYV